MAVLSLLMINLAQISFSLKYAYFYVTMIYLCGASFLSGEALMVQWKGVFP